LIEFAAWRSSTNETTGGLFAGNLWEGKDDQEDRLLDFPDRHDLLGCRVPRRHYDTHRQVGTLANVDKLSDQVVAGKRAFEKYNCNDCHTILGFGGYYAPDLTRVVQRSARRGSATA